MRYIFASVICLAAVCCGGCETITGGALFGGNSQRNTRKLEELNRETRLSELEAMVSRLDKEIDVLNTAINDQSARYGELSERLSAETKARTADLTAIRDEFSGIKNGLKQTDSRLTALPGNFQKLLDEQKKSLMSTVDGRISESRRASSSAPAGLSGDFYEHEVKSGETVSEIAQAYGVRTSDIVRANKLKDASSIRAGQKLLVPAK